MANLIEPLKPLFRDPIEPELSDISKVFVKLQDTRHLAGYDVYAPITFATASGSVDDARRLIVGGEPGRGTEHAHAFLAALLLNKH